MEGWRHFQLADEEIDSTTQVIDIAGDATEYTVPELKERIVELIASGKDRMLVDKRSTRVKTLRLNARDTVAKLGIWTTGSGASSMRLCSTPTVRGPSGEEWRAAIVSAEQNRPKLRAVRNVSAKGCDPGRERSRVRLTDGRVFEALRPEDTTSSER